MTEAVVFPDVELWATTYLRSTLAAHGYGSVVVSNRYDGQAQAVWVRRDGGPQLDHLREAARLGVNVFYDSPTDQPVADLAAVVSALLRAGADGTVVKVTQTSGPSPVADAKPRRFLTFEVTTRGTALQED